MRVTLVHPCMGTLGEVRSMRTWEMQPLWAAALKAYTPAGVTLTLVDDRIEAIDRLPGASAARVIDDITQTAPPLTPADGS